MTGLHSHRGVEEVLFQYTSNFGAKRSRESGPRPGHFTPRKDSVPIVQEARWASSPVWTPPRLDPRTVQPVEIAIMSELSRHSVVH
jgi:hypothetical protein